MKEYIVENENGTISFFKNRSFVFDEVRSAGHCNEAEIITMPNILAMVKYCFLFPIN